jgi:hypothetical protein
MVCSFLVETESKLTVREVEAHGGIADIDAVTSGGRKRAASKDWTNSSFDGFVSVVVIPLQMKPKVLAVRILIPALHSDCYRSIPPRNNLHSTG